MTINISQFNQTFFDECSEHLAEMERLLLAVDPHSPVDEDLNAIFRAAHSIKGGAGIFGFMDMTVVTHALETQLDKVRNHEIPLTPEMVNTFLEAGDVVSMQLAGHRDGTAVDQQVIDAIRSRLETVATGESASPWTPESAGGAVAPVSIGNVFTIEFTPGIDTFRRGVKIENLLEELAGLGTITVVADTPELPRLDDLDPEDCHLRWRMTLVTDAAECDIRDIFEFVAEDEELLISMTEAISATDTVTNPAGIPAMPGNKAPVTAPPVSPLPSPLPSIQARPVESADNGSIRVSVPKVDNLINLVGELVITQAMLTQSAEGLDPVLFETLHRALMLLERNTREIQESAMAIRMIPVSSVFNRFPRMVKDTAAKLGKQARLVTAGETTELDKTIIEKITDPLTHLIRNSVDHGIEPEVTRIAAGKDPVGTITLRAWQQGGKIHLEVSDDGSGLNREKILDKARSQGMQVNPGMTDDEVWQLIFSPGFSTADAVTDVSGRGVGMDVVLKNVMAIGGRVHISSVAGQGTRMTISLPLTLAILDGLTVAVGDRRFILPLTSIIESLQPKPEDISMVKGDREVLRVRGEYLPILKLYEILGIDTKTTRPEQGILVLVDAEGERMAIMVDALLGGQQVVIKSLETNYRKVEGTAGATIMGDGRVALILDTHGIAEIWKQQGRQAETANAA